MFGWEYPPFLSGGLGVATEGLVRGLLETGAEVVLVLPHSPPPSLSPRLTLIDAEGEATSGGGIVQRRRGNGVRRVPALLRPYASEADYAADLAAAGKGRSPFRHLYGPNLAAEVLRFARLAGRIARRERFDVIHAHDWLTFAAGLEARRVSARPLVAHVHATEFDRSGGPGNRFVSGVEGLGLAAADRVIAVSRYTAEVVHSRYGVPEDRIRVVHNAIDAPASLDRLVRGSSPLVLFAGRVTWQKGPRYFVEAAALVAREMPEVRFAVAGAGDGLTPMRDLVAALGLTDRFRFTGFLPSEDLDRLYAQAAVYVMPSVSEPFGLTALEALRHGTPVVVSRHAGVSEVVRHVLRVDFDDTRDIASKILSVLLYRPLSQALSREGSTEVRRLSWRDAAEKCRDVYREIAPSGSPIEFWRA